MENSISHVQKQIRVGTHGENYGSWMSNPVFYVFGGIAVAALALTVLSFAVFHIMVLGIVFAVAAAVLLALLGWMAWIRRQYAFGRGGMMEKVHQTILSSLDFDGHGSLLEVGCGTGLGGGIILNGKMFNGGMNQGVELGHAYLVDDGEYCTCGNHGCMEAYCAASALAREGARAMQSDPRGLLAERSGGNAALIDAKMVVDCAKAGDVTAKRVFDEYIGHLSSACASFFNILDPEVLAIGGGLCGAGEFLFAPLRERVTEKCFYKSHGAVVPAVMGNDAGIIGAAMLRRDTELR